MQPLSAPIPVSTAPSHKADNLISLFNSCFADTENTILVRGGSEPVYVPADESHSRNRVIFAHGFFASALHEIAHWCIAGRERRTLVDYGYWYRPDGRSAGEQAEFERVEARPQALEWAFHLAAGSHFDVSVDNLAGAPVDRNAFRRRVHAELLGLAKAGFPPRGRQFIDALTAAFGCAFSPPARPEDYWPTT